MQNARLCSCKRFRKRKTHGAAATSIVAIARRTALQPLTFSKMQDARHCSHRRFHQNAKRMGMKAHALSEPQKARHCSHRRFLKCKTHGIAATEVFIFAGRTALQPQTVSDMQNARHCSRSVLQIEKCTALQPPRLSQLQNVRRCGHRRFLKCKTYGIAAAEVFIFTKRTALRPHTFAKMQSARHCCHRVCPDRKGTALRSQMIPTRRAHLSIRTSSGSNGSSTAKQEAQARTSTSTSSHSSSSRKSSSRSMSNRINGNAVSSDASTSSSTLTNSRSSQPMYTE